MTLLLRVSGFGFGVWGLGLGVWVLEVWGFLQCHKTGLDGDSGGFAVVELKGCVQGLGLKGLRVKDLWSRV